MVNGNGSGRLFLKELLCQYFLFLHTMTIDLFLEFKFNLFIFSPKYPIKMFLKNSPPPPYPHLAFMLYPKQQEMNETLVFLGVRMSSRVTFSVDWHVYVKLAFRLLLCHFTNSTTCCITMTSHFCSFIMPLLHLLWLLTFFFLFSWTREKRLRWRSYTSSSRACE